MAKTKKPNADWRANPRRVQILETITGNLVKVVQARGISACNLADNAGLPRMTVYRFLRGGIDPNLSVAYLVARVLRVGLDVLANDDKTAKVVAVIEARRKE